MREQNGVNHVLDRLHQLWMNLRTHEAFFNAQGCAAVWPRLASLLQKSDVALGAPPPFPLEHSPAAVYAGAPLELPRDTDRRAMATAAAKCGFRMNARAPGAL